MKLGIIGLPQSGKSTVFSALSGARGQKEGAGRGPSRGGPRIATVTVFDERMDFLTQIYRPKKTTYAKIEYLLPSQIPGSSPSKSEDGVLNQVRVCDALLAVVRNFEGSTGTVVTPEQDFLRLEEEMVLIDLAVVEKRITGNWYPTRTALVLSNVAPMEFWRGIYRPVFGRNHALDEINYNRIWVTYQ